MGLLLFWLIPHRTTKKGNDYAMEDLMQDFESALQVNKEVEGALKKYVEEITPVRAYQLFEKIRIEDIYLFDMNPEFCKPVDMIITHLPVPPVCIRPSVQASEGVSNEDDLTVKLGEIIQVNNLIKINIQEGLPMNKVMEDWSLLQYTTAQYINSDTPGLPLNLLGNKSIRALCQRLKGKQGRFRGNLSGKRVDFSGRTVISPDPNLGIDQVGVPEHMAKLMTYPERVTDINLEKMKRIVINGPDKHPGANYVEFTDGNKIYLQYANRRAVADQLKPGDIVERHIIDNDPVLFNRQPSLHRLSIMCHRVKVMPWRTLRFNECVCTPYNADFDGDEMNLHVPQTEEALAEAATLMAVKPNIISPRSGDPIIGATQDFLTAAYLLTQREVFLDRAEFCRVCGYIGDAEEWIELPHPTIVKPIELWTGKQVIGILLRPSKKSQISVNIEVKEKNYSGIGECMCPSDGWVIIKNSELLCGNIGKTTIGGGSKIGLVYSLMKDNNANVAADCLQRISKLSGRWLSNYGMSIGISDVWPFEKVVKEKEGLLSKSYATCDSLIEQYNKGEILLKPGCNMEQSLEHYINGELGKVRDKAGDVLKATLPRRNSPLIMAVCGSKGSYLNLCQMIACVGQQTVSGNRIPNGFSDRSLPHFEKHAKHPAAKGFVKNSFFNGLNATEFFFHTMGGREGLVDTAVKTAETGYMQRRLMKAMEDLSIKYDNTVRNSSEDVIEFLYGDDSLDALSMEDGNLPVPFGRLFNRIKSTSSMYPGERSLYPYELIKSTKEAIMEPKLKRLPVTDRFKEELVKFVTKYANKLAGIREKLGLEPALDESDTVMRTEGDEIIDKNWKICKPQMEVFYRTCWEKYQKAFVAPGEAVGAVAAQSIGEPSTQMTLKTFHFAGVASMNITLGVPRIKEIINSVKDISTPIITATLVNPVDQVSARIVKGRIEKTLLGDIAVYIKEVYRQDGCYITVKLDKKAIEVLMLDIDAETVREAILRSPKLHVKNIQTVSDSKLRIEPTQITRDKLLFSLLNLKNNLPHVIISGIPTIQRAVINRRTNTDHNLLVEGMGLKEVMCVPGIDGTKTWSNHILEVEKVLGIEAARQSIINEIRYTLQQHSLNIDSRHLTLLADVMTFKGMVLGITRFGVSKMRDSTLMLASFEKTIDHLFDAAVHCREDQIKGVSECIIMVLLANLRQNRGCRCHWERVR
eukprot:TRINITY_DN826_c0_g1_i2.p1 TRINITY_DN826_c0_g1~~TRINITY_DN826_c0_g1_i2.p1  ORF type:complete len:1204 (+),score=111.45 TRINITY_DN826_c0_g1_i2:2266-5877(+)